MLAKPSVLSILLLLLVVPLGQALAQEDDEGGGDEGGGSEGCATFEDCEAQISDRFHEELDPETIRGAIDEAADEADPASEDGNEEEGVEADDTPKVRPGTAADVVKKITATEPVKTALKKLEKAAVEKVKTDWKKLKTGEKVSLLIVAAPIAVGIAAIPGLASPVQSLINNTINKLLKPKMPWLTLRADLVSPNKVFEVRVDIFELLRKTGVKL
ncbi:MAG: hypothetical protein KC620_18685 [Myxococcales bacterium]|nr:hypothetical protein [Myxococcales bacterium]